LAPTATSLLYCQEAKELLDALTEAVRDLVSLHAQQFDALMTGDLDTTRFDDLIHLANQRKRGEGWRPESFQHDQWGGA
jgi:hypothetical protein